MKRLNTSIILKTLLLIAFVCHGFMAMAQKKGVKEWPVNGYKFVLTIKGNTDSIMYLGNYYAGGTYASDTARRNSKGQFVFEKKNRPVFPGLYFFTSPSGRHVEFVVYNEMPNLTFVTDEKDWVGNMTVKGSKENEVFFSYQKANDESFRKIQEAKSKMSEEEHKKFRHEIMVKNDDLKMSIIENHPDCFVTLLMNATRTKEPPAVDEKGDSLSYRQRWEWYMDHYFDYMRLDDDALVRTPDPVFHKRVMDYLDHNLKGATPEVLCEYIDKLIERSRPSKEVYKYLVHTITEKYLQSKIMSYDAVYVHMVKKYYAEGNYWSSPKVIDEQIERATTWERLLIGKTAPDLILRDMQGYPHQLSGLKNKYTLLIFWSPTCGHCKTVIPALYKSFEKYKDRCDISAFAILSEPDSVTRIKWQNFIETNKMTDPQWIHLDGGEANIDWHEVYDIETTPQIYLLDNKKKILAKKLNAESFEMVIKQIENIED